MFQWNIVTRHFNMTIVAAICSSGQASSRKVLKKSVVAASLWIYEIHWTLKKENR